MTISANAQLIIDPDPAHFIKPARGSGTGLVLADGTLNGGDFGPMRMLIIAAVGRGRCWNAARRLHTFILN